MGEILEADKNLKIVLSLDPNNASILAEQKNLNALKSAVTSAETSYGNKDYRQVGPGGIIFLNGQKKLLF